MKFRHLTIILLALFLTPLCVYANDIDSMIFYPQETPNQETPEVFSPLNANAGEIIFKQNTRKFDSIDPSFSASIYPGGRGADKLVIYTPNFGLHTGTNEFGTEAIVEDNTVTALSGADSTIPKNGIVISGHGIAKKWITQNITVGSKVYIDIMNKTITDRKSVV